MADLLSSSDNDDERIGIPAARLSPPRSTTAAAAAGGSGGVSSNSSNASARIAEPLGNADDGSESGDGDLLESLFPSTSRAERTYSQSSDSAYAAVRTATHTPHSSPHSASYASKPIISARELLHHLLPSKSATASATPASQPRQASQQQQQQPAARGSTDDRLSTSQRIALKYGLVPSQTLSQDTVDSAADTSSAEPQQHKATYRTPLLRTPPPTAPTKRVHDHTSLETTTAMPSLSVQRRRDDEHTIHTAPTRAYVSPFARKDGLADAKRQQQQTRAAATTASTAISQYDAHVPSSDAIDDDEWFSDAKELDAEVPTTPQTKKRTRAVSKRSSPRRPNALALEHVAPRSFKRQQQQQQQQHATLSDDADAIPTERWPQLPPPAVDCGPLTLLPSAPDACAITSVCSNINSFLFDYQRDGAQFLFSAYSRNTGAILGDEMGLGKTIQVIAFIAAVLQKRGDASDRIAWKALRSVRRTRTTAGSTSAQGPGPILIVVPASLLHNWEAELHTWLCVCTVLLHGRPAERTALLEQITRGEFEVVIVSYDILKLTVNALNRVEWTAIVLDEMHCLKNPESQLTCAVQQLTCRRKLGLTGTLMQNNETELHCVVDTLAPGALETLSEFRAYYGDDIKYGRKKSAVAEALARSQSKQQALQRVLAPIYLRRDKCVNRRFDAIAKLDQVVFCDLAPLQLAAYERVLALPEFALLRSGDELCDCGRSSRRKRKQCCYQTPASLGADAAACSVLWRRYHESGSGCKHCPNCLALVCVTQLLKVANHVELLKVNVRDPPELQRATAAFAAQAFGDDLAAVGGVWPLTLFQKQQAVGTDTCGKLRVLEQLLRIWTTRKEKTLLFSRSTRMLDILQLFLVGRAISYLRLDGQTRVDERLKLVTTFNRVSVAHGGASVFLISTRAGGLGLNLPAASNVVIFDPSWNPAHDCQAQDRAYRLGQTRDVHVYRLVTLGTIEEMMYVRQIYKQQLSDSTLQGAGQGAGKSRRKHADDDSQTKVLLPRYFDAVQGDRTQQGELFGIRNLLCWSAGGVLKGIQDAYRRSSDGFVTQTNRVDYTRVAANKAMQTTPLTTTGSRKTKRKRQQPSEDEMVDVANEFVALNDEHDDRVQDDDAARGVFDGARTMLHDAVVCDTAPLPLPAVPLRLPSHALQDGNADAVSESDDDDDDDDDDDELLTLGKRTTKAAATTRSEQAPPVAARQPQQPRSIMQFSSAAAAATTRKAHIYVPNYV